MFSMGIIDRYIGRTVLFVILLAVVVLLIITAIITVIDMSRHLGKGDIDIIFLMQYVAMLLPTRLLALFPIAVLLGCVIGLGIFAKNSELVIMQSAGLSKLRIVFSIFKSVFPLIITIAILGQTLIPMLDKYAESAFDAKASQGRLSRTSWGIWLREGNSFISIHAVFSDNSIHEIKRYNFDDMELKSIATAESGSYKDGFWHMNNVVNIDYLDNKVQKSAPHAETWELYLNPERLELFDLADNEMTVFSLVDYIKYLETNNIDTKRQRLTLYKKIWAPMVTVVMLLLGTSLVFGSLRSVSMSLRVVSGLGFGFAFYLLNELAPNFIIITGMPPLLGAVLPTFIFGCLALYMLMRKV